MNFRTFSVVEGESAKFSTKSPSPYLRERVFFQCGLLATVGGRAWSGTQTFKSWPPSLCPGEPALMNENTPQLIGAYRAAGEGWEEWTAANG